MESQVNIVKEIHAELYKRFQADAKAFRDKYGGRTFKFNKVQSFDKTRFRSLRGHKCQT